MTIVFLFNLYVERLHKFITIMLNNLEIFLLTLCIMQHNPRLFLSYMFCSHDHIGLYNVCNKGI